MVRGTKMKLQDFQEKKQRHEKITMITCYDYPTAKIAEASNIDAVLVGDTVSMVIHGHESTTAATIEMMALHTKAVRRGIKTKFLVADMPFLSYRRSKYSTMEVVYQLIQAGAEAVKLEGAEGNLDIINHIVDSGVPVMGHIGLTPQHINRFGGYKIQGKDKAAQKHLIEEAKALEAAGCFSVVLECIPTALAKTITNSINIPTIGIGAGPDTDGQILVWHDALGIQKDFKPRFVKYFQDGFSVLQDGINQYVKEVKEQTYPDIDKHSY